MKAVERLHETKKRESLSGDDETPRKTARCSGHSTITYLRQKTEKDFDFRERELVLKEKELDLDKKRQELNKAQLMKVINIAYAMIKLQCKLPQTLISRGFTRRTVLHVAAFQQKGINRLMDIYQIWKPKL